MQNWTTQTWMTHLEKGSDKKNSELPGFLRLCYPHARHPRYNRIDCICHVGSSQDRISIINEGKMREKDDNHILTAVDPMSEPRKDEPCDLTKPRQVPHRTRWKTDQNAVYWIYLKITEEK